MANEWGCEGREKLGKARGTLDTLREELEQLRDAVAPLLVDRAQSSYITDTFAELIAIADKAFKDTGMEQVCVTEAPLPPPPECATCGRAHIVGKWWPRHPFKPMVRVAT